VTLVCAPAGSGKTALLRSWTTGLTEAVAWVTVERDEHDAQRFWLQLIAALADAAPADIVERVSPAPSFAGSVVVERLRDQLGLLDKPLRLVIDDLHELHSTDAAAWLERLLAWIPSRLHVVLATREDPGLGLHRLRVAGELTEMRGPDLSFSLDETRELLRASGIDLSDSAVASLHERTEGWPAGLRLAAISLAGSPDPEQFVSEFSGSERTVASYLLTEVLERQPPQVRDMLLRTSILDRVCGPLADALTGSTRAETTLQTLEDQNAFVSSLDAARTWFHYHHLFADLLRLELRRTAPLTIPSLHSTAAAWYELDGDVVEAIRHAQASGDWPRAGRLLVDNYLALSMAGRGQTLHALIEAFPPQSELGDANIAAAFAVDTILHGVLDDAAAHLATARAVAPGLPAGRRRLLDAYLAVIGLELARRHNDLAKAEEAMRELAAASGPSSGRGELPVRPEYLALSLMNVGIVELWAGRYDDARRHLEDALDRTRRIGRPFIEVGCVAHLAVAALLTGQPLPLALELSERALAIAEEHGWTSESMATGAFGMAGMALVMMGRFADAERHFDRADESLRAAADPGTEITVRQGRSLLRFAEGRFEEALAESSRADELERLFGSEHVFTAEIRARAIQLRVRMGETESARTALAELEPQERERAGMRIALGALHLEDGAPEEAVAVLAPAIESAEGALYKRRARVEALVLEAAARDRLGDRRAAEDSLERALDIAEPDGLILPFMIWPSRELLERHPRHRTAHAAFVASILDTLAGDTAARPSLAAPPRDELSEAELRVVRYLPSNLTASEIASELVVSTNTVRTHMRHIYAKLDAHTRSEAVARARELGLVAPGALRR
jgi:LuxR family transcriptional regulator, maltose regulon positive regulatory protein